MSMNTLGRLFRITVFGESHGACVGVVVGGCPPGLEVSEADIQRELDKRRPGQSALSTARKERDKIVILSGILKGRTTGSPIAMLVWNEDVDSSSYEQMKDTPRPGHADFTARLKYKGLNDYRGGGIFSGRMTAAFVMAGAVAKKLLARKGIEARAHSVQIGRVSLERKIPFAKIKTNNQVRCADARVAKMMEKEILMAKADGDSVGGVVECAVNAPAGLGEPMFDKLDADIAKAMFAIPAVKGIEFGDTKLRGSENNDPFIVRGGKVLTKTNNAGGVLGGISTGMPVVFRVKIKPTASIAKEQQTVNLKSMKPATIRVGGRHDSCIVPRAVPVVEALAACVIADHLLRGVSRE